MKKEIYERGPIACDIGCSPEFDFYTGGILCDETGWSEVDHLITIFGWGEEDGQKYWLVRNSWGTYWGENGFGRICRGENNLKIESKCHWITPVDTWTEKKWHITTDAEKNDPNNDKTVYQFPQSVYVDGDN